MRKIAVFDFDGTITRCDTFLLFIKYVRGPFMFLWGMFLLLPILVAYKLKICPNWKAKQIVFSYFFRGMTYKDFQSAGIRFSAVVNQIVRPIIVQKIKEHKQRGEQVFIISASISEWIVPWARENGIDHVLSTQIEVNESGMLTGKLLSKNCYGSEKVRRLLEIEPHREDYYLFVYGDSSGDKELMAFADEGFWV